MIKFEMDTSAHDLNRVFFTTTSDDEDLLFLSPRLFKDEYGEAAVAAEDTEELKRQNPMEWVRHCNNIRNRVAEIIKQELIYV